MAERVGSSLLSVDYPNFICVYNQLREVTITEKIVLCSVLWGFLLDYLLKNTDRGGNRWIDL